MPIGTPPTPDPHDMQDALRGPRTFPRPGTKQIKLRAASCVDCGSHDTRFGFLYRFRWYRKWRRKVKLCCRACEKIWWTRYP